MTQTIKKKYLESHEIGEIYIHDIECIPTGITGFTELELSEKLEEDFAKDRNIREEEMDIYSYTNIISNIILLTSLTEGYPVVFQEAMVLRKRYNNNRSI